MKVELQLSPDPAERITRAADEEAIRDINLYLFGRSNGQSLHFYFRSALVRLDVYKRQLQSHPNLSPLAYKALMVASSDAFRMVVAPLLF